MPRSITITELAEQVATSRPQRANQLKLARAIIAEHPGAVLLECADEHTGVRFGSASRRIGQCFKIGGARQSCCYQIWASWAPADVADYGR